MLWLFLRWRLQRCGRRRRSFFPLVCSFVGVRGCCYRRRRGREGADDVAKDVGEGEDPEQPAFFAAFAFFFL